MISSLQKNLLFYVQLSLINKCHLKLLLMLFKSVVHQRCISSTIKFKFDGLTLCFFYPDSKTTFIKLKVNQIKNSLILSLSIYIHNKVLCIVFCICCCYQNIYIMSMNLVIKHISSLTRPFNLKNVVAETNIFRRQIPTLTIHSLLRLFC